MNMSRKSLVVFVISVFLFSVLALSGVYASKNHHPQAAGIEVYDANGQYLGILVSFLAYGSHVMLYNSAQSSFVAISKATGEIVEGFLYFQGSACAGTPHVLASYTSQIISSEGKYYIGAKTAPFEMDPASVFSMQNGCTDNDTERYYYVVPAKEISVDLLPFTVPVGLPLEFK